MPLTNNEQALNRRAFLKAVMATAVTAAAAGTGAAYLLDQKQATFVNYPAAVRSPVAPSIVAASQNGSELLARLVAAQAENVRLQAELDAAGRKLEGMQKASNGSGAMAEELHSQLDAANGQIGVLAGLVALYEQLDEIDLGAILNDGLGAVDGAIAGLLDKVPTLEEGLAAGHLALDEFEAHIPLVENGRLWLISHLNKVRDFYIALENVLQVTVETAGAFLVMLSDWFQSVLKWLPFGMGDKAASIMNAMTNLLAETPNTISGLHTNLAQPLEVWFGGSGGEMPVRQKLIKPLREKALPLAGEAAARARDLQAVYQLRLAQPVQMTAGARGAVRQQIAEFRQRYGM